MTDRTNFKLEIRAARPEDWEQTFATRNEPGVRPNILAIPFENPIRFRDRRTQPMDGSYALIAEATLPDGTKEIAGDLGLHVGKLSETHSGAFGISVRTDYQGRGVGSALMAAMCDLADNWMNLHRIELEVFTDNPRGLALYRKFGFEIEATLRQYAFRDGAYVDAYIMGRINPRHTTEAAP
jgi:putative acetyltransferase